MSEANINKISIKEFMTACHDGNLNIVKQYVEQGGDIHVRTSNGNDGFSRAIYKGHIEVAKYLLENGADINAQSEKSKTPLHRAIIRAELESIKFLLENGADLNLQDERGNTPLHYAARFNYNIVAKLLIDCGARDDIVNHKGTTASYEAQSPRFYFIETDWNVYRNMWEKSSSLGQFIGRFFNVISNPLYSDELGSVQEIIEAKLAEKWSQKWQQFEEKLEKAISNEAPDSQIQKIFIRFKNAVDYKIKSSPKENLDQILNQVELMLNNMLDAYEGKVYTVKVEGGDITNDSAFSADDQGLAGKSPVTNEDIHPEPTDSNSATIIDNNQ